MKRRMLRRPYGISCLEHEERRFEAGSKERSVPAEIPRIQPPLCSRSGLADQDAFSPLVEVMLIPIPMRARLSAARDMG